MAGALPASGFTQFSFQQVDASRDARAQFGTDKKAVLCFDVSHDRTRQPGGVWIGCIGAPISANGSHHARIVVGIGTKARQVPHADLHGLGPQGCDPCSSLPNRAGSRNSWFDGLTSRRRRLPGAACNKGIQGVCFIQIIIRRRHVRSHRRTER